jgi:hypothetical protein
MNGELTAELSKTFRQVTDIVDKVCHMLDRYDDRASIKHELSLLPHLMIDAEHRLESVEPVPGNGYENGRRNMIEKLKTTFQYMKINAAWGSMVPDELKPMFYEIEDAMKLVDAVRSVAQKRG